MGTSDSILIEFFVERVHLLERDESLDRILSLDRRLQHLILRESWLIKPRDGLLLHNSGSLLASLLYNVGLELETLNRVRDDLLADVHSVAVTQRLALSDLLHDQFELELTLSLIKLQLILVCD